MALVTPHGGSLVNRVLEGAALSAAEKLAGTLPSITLSLREQFDLEMIGNGAFSPLIGFMGKADFDSVCKNIRLANGTVWPIPVTLCPPDNTVASINVGGKYALKDDKGRVLGILTVTEKYAHDKELEIPNVYKTADEAHPGVAAVKKQGNTCVAGPIDVIKLSYEPEFPEYRLTPAQTRAAFAEKGWSTISAFPDAQPHSPFARVSHQGRPGNDRRAADSPAGRRKPSPTTSRPTFAWIVTKPSSTNITTPKPRCSPSCRWRCVTPARARRFCTR